MQLSSKEILKRLGDGQSISDVCCAVAVSRKEFDTWWQKEIRSRVPNPSGSISAPVATSVVIERDHWGIPHVFADSDQDLFFGFGVAVAQDRLFQLDYLRRKGMGRLSEVFGEDTLSQDSIARTVGLNRIAATQWRNLELRVRMLVESFTAGVNQVIADTADSPAIEFDLLQYRPEPWQPVDCLVIENEFQWYLTGRLPVIVIPELAKRVLGKGPLFNEFIFGEADDESILHPGDYEPATPVNESSPTGHAMNDPDATVGSNNWVLSGQRTTTSQPLLASDPHIAFEAVSCWHEIHLCGGSFHVAGMSYTGIPAVMFGRNEHVAWGITNNICSQRDLYQERTDPQHPGCFLYDDQWETERCLTEIIEIRDRPAVEKTIRFSRNGPIVDEILPVEAEHSGPVSLKWLGAHGGEWLTALLDMDRADSVSGFRQTLRPWQVPTFSIVIADTDGNIGFQTSGGIPIRGDLERGYRRGWDPNHQWNGQIPFESMPSTVNPSRGWVASANNRVAPNDFPWKLFGCWSSGWRARRIRNMIESKPLHAPDDMGTMHQDTMSLRAEELVPLIVPILQKHSAQHIQDAVSVLDEWNCRCDSDSIGATIFNVFFTHWCRRVASQRFDSDLIDLMSTAMSGCAGRLLKADPANWFDGTDRQQALINSFEDAVNMLIDRFGSDQRDWTWKQLHQMPLKHILSDRGDLSNLLNHGGTGVHGDMVTVCNTGSGDDWSAATGAGYRIVSDLSAAPPALRAIDAQSQSGHPGSLHYDDQYERWHSGDYHEIQLVRDTIGDLCITKLTLNPDQYSSQSIPE
ncbi:MAG: penicillin acylase family protein [Fuerstiella sp.]|nr:penicillin acylase family protein [Fuerstiella sp.]